MNNYIYISRIVLFLITLSSTSVHAMDTTEETFYGVARNDRGDIVYQEHHRVIYVQNRPQRNETRYSDVQGREFATLTSLFTYHPYVPEYTFVDRRFGREDRAQFLNAMQLIASSRATADAKPIEKKVKLPNDGVAGQGLHFFLRDHLDDLNQPGMTRKVEFVIPTEGQSYTFRIRRLKNPTATTAAFKIDIDSFFLRLFAPTIHVQYDIATGRLLSYQGASNLLTADQAVQNVTITYQYPHQAPAVATKLTLPPQTAH